jgi:aspartyl-tRNA(Asn)/glutamyl-tRNA(Gln) amidotransferase subunit C
MKITKELVEHMAKLSRIRLTKQEIEKFTPQMQTIMDSVKTLDEVDVSGVVLRSQRRTTLSDMRDDEVGESMSKVDVLANAEFTKAGMVMIPGNTVEGLES